LTFYLGVLSVLGGYFYEPWLRLGNLR